MKWSDVIHFIQGYYRSFIDKEYSRLFDQDSIRKLFYKAAKIDSSCLYRKRCLKCGCSIEELIFSDKECECKVKANGSGVGDSKEK